MKRIAIRVVPALVLLVAVYAWVAPLVSGQASGMPSTRNGEWPMYTADLRGSKYSPLDQINGTNFSKLEVAWRLKTDNFGPRPETKLEGTPIMVKGMLYATAGTRRAVVAVNPATGEIKWTYSLDEGERATRWAPRQLSGRGLSYWTDGKGDERVIYVTTGYRLVSLNAKTGQPVAGFGTERYRRPEAGHHHQRQAGGPREVGNRPPLDADRGERHDPRRLVDVRRPRLRIRDQRAGPGPRVRREDRQAAVGVPRHPEAAANSASTPGRTSRPATPATTACGRRSRPTRKRASSTCRSRRRPSTNTAATAPATTCSPNRSSRLTCETGVRKWHFQFVHHPLWDHDMSSAPLLIDTTIDGKPRKVVAVPSKQGWLYCFDRITGVPIWPIEEKPVPQTTMKHEQTAPTQPFPTKPVPYARTFIAESDLIDFTPALRTQALANLKFFRWEPTPYVPPTGPESKLFGAINIGNTAGGTNWPGAGFDVETGIFYSQAGMTNVTVGHYSEEEFSKVTPENEGIRTPRWEAEPNYGLRVERPLAGAGCAARSPGRRSTSPAAKAVASWLKVSRACRSSSRLTA